MSSRAAKGGRITAEPGRAPNSRDTRNRRTSPRTNPATADGSSHTGTAAPESRPTTADPAPDTVGEKAPETAPVTVTEKAPDTVVEQAPAADRATVAGEIRDAVLAVPGVVGLTAGTGVEVATLFPGGKVVGIRLGEPVEVHVAVGPVPIAPLAEQIQLAVRGVLAGFGQRPSVEVVVDDIDLPLPIGPADRS
ncbi:hypothetical protein GCM10022225_38180 [Plantactinospora mayteni]|uniref:Asp23/Gls24 family envelope stress response protein n=1 Tax=Plantactinospora mayteni TaxID=566021 RepID=A0ABQ4EX40_9ACTN|nr:hypothetical protein [Plantactinospora mayteni]GIG99162.1 hypothetical protein Pma05_57350 [Plantactinospora mayteni]